MTAAVFVGGLSGWWPLMVPLAFMLGCSRFHLRVHYPTDVAVGWIWGAALGGSALLIALLISQ
jgi:membrane-associated phospholipid phosphatase